MFNSLEWAAMMADPEIDDMRRTEWADAHEHAPEGGH